MGGALPFILRRKEIHRPMKEKHQDTDTSSSKRKGRQHRGRNPKLELLPNTYCIQKSSTLWSNNNDPPPPPHTHPKKRERGRLLHSHHRRPPLRQVPPCTARRVPPTDTSRHESSSLPVTPATQQLRLRRDPPCQSTAPAVATCAPQRSSCVIIAHPQRDNSDFAARSTAEASKATP